MARMSREFTLVLLGAGLLTAGYFLWPEDDPASRYLRRNDGGGGGGSGGSRVSRVYFWPIIIPGRTGVISSPAMASTGTIRGGLGRTGGFASFGG